MKLVFRPKTNTYQDILITARARRVWEERQGPIIDALEKMSGLAFTQSTIHAISGVFQGMNSGIPKIQAMSVPFNIRYEDEKEPHYQSDTEYIGSITHELAHRLLLEYRLVAPPGPQHNLEAHQHIYVFLLDAWQMAYGKKQAGELVRYEDNYASTNDYAAALDWSRGLSRAARQRIMQQLIRRQKLPTEARIVDKQEIK